MNISKLFESFVDRPMSHKIGLWVGTIVVILVGFWFFLYSPVLEEGKQLTQKVDELETQIAYERRLAQNLDRFKAEVKDLDIKLKLALQELPDKREIPELLSTISDLARDAGLDVNLFKPMPEVFRDFYADVPVAIEVGGNYHQVATSFDEVGQMDRIVNINNITMLEPKESGSRSRIKASCTATTFRYLDEDERRQSKKKGDGGKKRR